MSLSSNSFGIGFSGDQGIGDADRVGQLFSFNGASIFSQPS